MNPGEEESEKNRSCKDAMRQALSAKRGAWHGSGTGGLEISLVPRIQQKTLIY
jgi:hypothetical protein